MSITKLPSGRYRAQVWDAALGRNVSVSKVLSPVEMQGFGAEGATFARKTDARDARAAARRKLMLPGGGRRKVTVGEFRDRWLSDPLFVRPKDSTMILNRQRTGRFASLYGHLPLEAVDDHVVGEWLDGGRNRHTVMALRAMFNDAASRKAGRLVVGNPFSGLGLGAGPGNRDRRPPGVEQMRALIGKARELTPPSFADYLECACATGVRPGELDALRPGAVRWRDREIDIVEQFAQKVGRFTLPKYGPYTVGLTRAAEQPLRRAIDRDQGEFVFVPPTGRHYTQRARDYYWHRVRDEVGLGSLTLYLASRHYFAWHAVNVLGLETAVVAEQLGHKDGGRLVERLYGHPDRARRRRLLVDAHDEDARASRPLRAVNSEAR